MPEDRLKGITLSVAPALVLFLAATGGSRYGDAMVNALQEFWSPYYRIHYEPEHKVITVNLIGHQQMVSRQAPFPAYSLPHLLNRDSGRPPFGQVLIIGAGSGNDVSRALAWGAERVDAVEIDPVIYRLGRQHHPDHPYDDPRVFVHLNDGRNYPEVEQQAVRPHHLRAGRFAGAAQQLQQHPARELPVHQAGDGRRAQAAAAGRHLRHVQLFPPGLDRLAAAERSRVIVRRGEHDGDEPAGARHARTRSAAATTSSRS